MALLLRKEALSRCILVVSSRSINSCRTLRALRTRDLKLGFRPSTALLSSPTVQNGCKICNRVVSTSSLVCKWVTGRDAMGPELAPSMRVSHRDNPEFYTLDRTLKVEHPDDLRDNYRSAPPYILRDKLIPFDRRLLLIVSIVFWGNFFYGLYWHPHELFAHFYMPYHDEEFTDEELGIPPDDAPDPAYWGHHGEPQGTY